MQRFLQQATGDIPRNTAARTQTCKYAHDPTCVPQDSDAALHTPQEEGSAYNPCSRTRDTRYTHPAPRQTRTHTRRAGHASGHPALRGIYRCSWCRTNGEAEARCSERATTRSERTAQCSSWLVLPLHSAVTGYWCAGYPARQTRLSLRTSCPWAHNGLLPAVPPLHRPHRPQQTHYHPSLTFGWSMASFQAT